MSQKLTIVSLGMALPVLGAVTAAFAPGSLPNAKTPTALAAPARAARKVSGIITPEQAKAAALAAKPGTAGEVELETEDGKTLYSVEITTADGKKYDVEVDANTGKILEIEDETNEDEDED